MTSILNIPDQGWQVEGCLINFKWNINAKRKKACKRKIYNFKRADWVNMNNDLSSINWENLLSNCSVEAAWSKFKQKLLEKCDTHIPKI